MDELSEFCFEERDEQMIPVTCDGNPTVRLAHFLKPIMGSIDEPDITVISHCLSYLPATFEPRNWPLKVKFNGFQVPQKNWKKWVEKMASLHGHTWKKAGVHEAIINSTYEIQRNYDLILGLAEKWCPRTKSFIFSWGEATITLEDLLVLGFSVLGSPIFSHLGTDEFKKIEEKLDQARITPNKSASKMEPHDLWMNKFMDTGSDIEHEAFLALWLSRFVFSSSDIIIIKYVFPIAIHLARGSRVALSPAMLASIYRDLSLLKEKIVSSTNLDNTESTITIQSQFLFVQIWAWERFIELRPKPILIQNGEGRLAQWHGISEVAKTNVRMVLDSAKESFDWRPYCKSLKNWNFPMFYAEKQRWVSIGSEFCDELESFSRCVRVSNLVGVYCMEQYLPHRVAMQFGMDQDLPDCVSQVNHSLLAAWSDYNKPIGDLNLCIPSRLFEADVTMRYLNWWKQSWSHFLDERGYFFDHLPLNMISGSVKKASKRLKGSKENNLKKEKGILKGGSLSSSRKGSRIRKYIESFKTTPNRLVGMESGIGTSIPINCKVKQKQKEWDTAIRFSPEEVKYSVETLKEHKKVSDASTSGGLPSMKIKKEYGDLSFPPGFAPKSKLVEEIDNVEKRTELVENTMKNEHVMVGLVTTTCMEDAGKSKTGSHPAQDRIEIQDGDED